MTSTLRRSSAAALALGLLFGAVACSSESDGESGASTTTAASSGTDGTNAGDGTQSDSTNPCDAPRLAGAGLPSRSLDVSFGSESKVTPETTITVSADGTSISPSSLTVDVGEAIGARVADGGPVTALGIGCSDEQTLLDTFTSGFVIEKAGTYPFVLDGKKVGTVTAK